MIGDTARPRSGAGRGGFLPSLLKLANTLAAYFESRFELFAGESKRALVQMVLLVGLVGAAILFFALGYIFLIVTIAAALATALGVDWIWVALGGAVLHFVIAVVFLLMVRSRMVRAQPFPETVAELKKDREWLKTLDRNSEPLN